MATPTSISRSIDRSCTECAHRASHEAARSERSDDVRAFAVDFATTATDPDAAAESARTHPMVEAARRAFTEGAESDVVQAIVGAEGNGHSARSLYESATGYRATRPSDGADRYEIVGKPGRRPTSALREGDVILRGVGGGRTHLAVIADSTLLSADDVALQRLESENGRAGGRWVRVVESGRGEADFARVALLDGQIVPYDQVILRVQSAGPVAAESITPEQQQALVDLARYTAAGTEASVDNALAILRAVGTFYGVPWALGYVLLEHEGGVRLVRHNDGVMQTTSGARTAAIRAMPRELQLALLELPATDASSGPDLERALASEFHRPRLAVQIAAGMMELKTNLDRFNGYVALACIAYNAGSGWAYHLATRGAQRSRPRAVSSEAWENACRAGAALAHQAPSALRIDQGVWQCDHNMPGWFRAFFVRDASTALTIVAYQYLRSVRACIRQHPPTTPCTVATHGQRDEGTGEVHCADTRAGVLDKLYSSTRLGRPYRSAVATTFPSLVDDGRPLKVVDGQLVTMPPASTASTAPSQSMQPGEWFDHVDDTQLEAREVDGFRGEGWAPEDATDALIGVRNRVRPRETVAAATVTLRSDAGVVVHAAATGANGRATIPLAGLPDGQYSLSITHASQSTNDVGPSIGGAGAPDRIWAPLASTMRIEGERFTSSSASQIAIGAGGRSVTVDLQPLWMRSPNFVRPRRSTLSHVVIHHTAGPVIGPALETFLSAGHTSAHYVVDVDGQIIKMVHEDDESAHAGCSHWGGVDSVNKVTVGIEIVNSRGAYPAAQMTSLLGLLERIFSANPRLSRRAVMSHADIATNCVNPGCDPAGCVTGPTRRLGRKSGDPGSEFDWPILEAAGFGMIPVARNPWPAMFGGFFDLVANGHLREGDADATRTFDGAVRAIDHGVIHELQIDLAELGYFCPRTGVFDRATRAAVEIFQEHFFAGSRRRTLRGGEVDQPTADMIKRVIGHSPPGDYPLPPTVTGGTRFA